MKKILVMIGFLLSYSLTFAQLSPTENYVYSKTYLVYDVNNQPLKISEAVQYFDGLGRPKQVVDIKATPTGKDVVTHIEYDGFGRQVKDYLPIPQQGTQNGGIYASPLSNATLPTLYGTEKIFSEKILESSPLDRILQQKRVGNAWNDKPVQFTYDANIAGDAVKKYIAITTWEYNATKSVLTPATTYATSQLHKSTITDEDGNQTIEFKNGEGQVVLERKIISAAEKADTYYVYNEYEQLAFVIPPLAAFSGATDETTLNNLCYQYKYDSRNRMVGKKLPGKGWEYLVYDKQDRLVMTQDANKGASKQWLFTKYDQFGRVAYTGIYTSTESYGSQGRAAEQDHVDSAGGNNVTRLTTVGFNSSSMDVYYNNSATSSYPNSITKLLSINYYDFIPGYNFNPNFPPAIINEPTLKEPSTTQGLSTKSLPVMTLLKNIEDDNWTKNYTYYDKRGREIGSYSINHLGGRTQVESKLDFDGVVQQKITRHKRLSTDTDKVITENYTYDPQNRLITHKHQVDNNPVEILLRNEYNELSQVKNKKVGGTDPLVPIQSIDYLYNVHGWLTHVNNPQNLGTKLFAYELKFTDPAGSPSSPYYNGNIAEMDWISTSSNGLRRYSYTYDHMGRLESGIYSEPNASIPQNEYYNELLSYDLNGNITTLKRYRNAQDIGQELIDDLSYSYTGNRLHSVTDNSGNYLGYPDTSGSAFTYDDNGNMTSHVDKGMLQIDHNYLNLPTHIKFNQFVSRRGQFYYVTTDYKYRGDGEKLTKRYNYFIGSFDSPAISHTDYLDGFQYKNTSSVALADNTLPMALQFAPTSEGYYDFVQNKYIYQYKDQIGNVRVAYYRDQNGNAKVDRNTDFYPFGLEFGGNGLNIEGSLSPQYLFSFQEQEKQEETGWVSFKWRNYDPSYARFFNPDPLSEEYAYQSHYNFSENAVVNARELEGLEKVVVLGRSSAAAGAAAQGSTKTGAYNELKRYTQTSLRYWLEVADHNYNLIKAGGTFGVAVAAKVLKSEDVKKSKSGESGSKDEGVVYKRKDKNGKEKDYVGQAKNEGRYEKRKKEHQRKNPDADYDFEVLERGEAGKDLNQKEQKHIEEGGGPTNKSNPNGGLENKRNQIKPNAQPKVTEIKQS